MDIYKDRIKPLFDESGLSNQEIADAIGAKVRDLYHWKNDGYKTWDRYIYPIAEKFGVSVAYLKGETDDKNPAPSEGDGLVEKLRYLRLTPGFLEKAVRFFELAQADPETAERFLSFAVQELESYQQTH